MKVQLPNSTGDHQTSVMHNMEHTYHDLLYQVCDMPLVQYLGTFRGGVLLHRSFSFLIKLSKSVGKNCPLHPKIVNFFVNHL